MFMNKWTEAYLKLKKYQRVKRDKLLKDIKDSFTISLFITFFPIAYIVLIFRVDSDIEEITIIMFPILMFEAIILIILTLFLSNLMAMIFTVVISYISSIVLFLGVGVMAGVQETKLTKQEVSDHKLKKLIK